MKPYYEEPGIQIFLGDCREILPSLPTVDLVLTDPPYPGLVGGHKRDFPGGVTQRKTITESIGQEWQSGLDWMEPAWDRCLYGMIVFCSFHSVASIRTRIASVKPIALSVWYKRNSPPTGKNLPRYTTEFIWMFSKFPGLKWDVFDTTLFDVPLPQAGCFAVERELNSNGTTAHPTQKPLALISSLLRIGGEVILDPFMGSGTTLRAAKDLGRQAIGIEIEERYCEIAVRRLAQAVLPLDSISVNVRKGP